VAGILRERIVDGQLGDGDLLPEHDELARQFHELLVSLCGNETLILTVGARGRQREAAGHLDAGHLQHSQRYTLEGSGDQVVRATSLRDGLRDFGL
jgi:DNA-binding GntR family transcriptional regulator